MFDITGPTGAQTVLDDLGNPVSVPTYGVPTAAPVSGTAFTPPAISGGQYEGDTQTANDGDVTNVTARQWQASTDGVAFTDVSGATSGTWNLTDVAWYRLAVTGDIDGVTDTYLSPIKGRFAAMDMAQMQFYEMSEMADHIAMDNYAMQMVDHDQATMVFTGTGSPQDPENWTQKRLPVEGDTLLIPHGSECAWDYVNCPRFHKIRVDGALTANPTTENLVLFYETMVVSRTGVVRIGTEAVPVPSAASVTFLHSNRNVLQTNAAPTDLDIANDPMLMGRGIVSLGTFETFGFNFNGMVWTDDSSLPVVGDVETTVLGDISAWEVGQEICIPTTAWAPQADQSIARMTEYRIIAGFTGQSVEFNTPLIYPHDNWHDAQRDPNTPRDTATLRIPICLMHRNVMFETEGGDEAFPEHQRAHLMFMHHNSKPRLEHFGTRFMGRTNKQEPAGIIESGQFKVRVGEDTTALEPLTATSNRIGRYALHLHLGNLRNPPTNRPTIRGGLFEGNAGHAAVVHDVDADVIDCVAVRCCGSAFLWESGREIGWAKGLFATDFYKDVSSIDRGYTASLKSSINSQGDQVHDLGTQLSTTYFAGRAVVARDIGGTGCQFVGMWNSRYTDERASKDALGFRYDMPRAISPFPWLADHEVDHIDTIQNAHSPLFTRGFYGVGVQEVLSVLKRSEQNGHDFQSVFNETWGFNNEDLMKLNYIVLYLLLNSTSLAAGFGKFIANSDFRATTIKQPKDTKGLGGGRVSEVHVVNSDIQNSDGGITLDGGYLAQANNNQFTKLAPRFVISGFANVNNNVVDIDLSTELFGPGQNEVLTPDVSVVGDATGYQPLVMDVPFILGTYGDGNTITNAVYGTKQCSFNLIPEAAALGAVSPFPSAFAADFAAGTVDDDAVGDFKGCYGDWDRISMRLLLEAKGYWVDDQGRNLILIHHYNTPRLDENEFQVSTHAVEIFAGVDLSTYTNNGSITVSGIKPTANNFNVTATVGTPLDIDVLALSAAATTATGATLSLMDINYRNPTYATIGLDASTGTATLYPFQAGDDFCMVTITDGQESFKTIRIGVTIVEPS